MSYAVEVSPVGTVGNLDSLARASRGIRWHVFHARTSYERQADLVLRRLGMETFLPLRLERWHGADRYIVAGLPGYTFARFDNNASPTTRMPANIPDAPVDAIRRQCAGDGVIYPDDWREGADGLMLPPRSGDRRKQVFDGFAALKAHIDALVTTEARRRSAVELVA
jgi:hypothetical protein